MPLLLSPGVADVRAVLALLLAALAFGLLDSAGPALPSLARRPRTALTRPGTRAAGTVLFALGAAAVVGPGLATVFLVLLAVETCRHAVATAPRERPVLGTGLAAAGLLLRFDAGSVALGIEPAPELLGAGCLLALFLALAFRSTSPSPGKGRRGGSDLLRVDFGLLALAAGVTALYAAALLGDPRIAEAAGVWPLATVPLVVAGLVRLWRAARTDAPADSPLRPDPWLVGTGTAWAGMLLLLLQGA